MDLNFIWFINMHTHFDEIPQGFMLIKVIGSISYLNPSSMSPQEVDYAITGMILQQIPHLTVYLQQFKWNWVNWSWFWGEFLTLKKTLMILWERYGNWALELGKMKEFRWTLVYIVWWRRRWKKGSCLCRLAFIGPTDDVARPDRSHWDF